MFTTVRDMGASRKILFLSAVASLLNAGPVFATASGSKCGVKQVGQVRASAKGTVRCECEAKGKSLTYTWKNYSAGAVPTALETTPTLTDPAFTSNFVPIFQRSNGQMIARSQFFPWTVAGINSDGSLDSSFAASIGSANTGGNVQAVAEQPDGKIILAGGFTSWNGRKVNGLVRLNSNGTFDESFNTDGVAGGGTVFSAAVLPDGKVMLAGTFLTWNGVTVNGIIRLNSDGTHDLAFTNSIGVKHTPPFRLVVDSTGKVILFSSALATQFKFGGTEFRGIARLNPDGSLDTAFAKNSNTLGNSRGILKPSSELQIQSVDSVGVQRDGKVLILAGFSQGCRIGVGLLRLNSNGTLDKTFNGPFAPRSSSSQWYLMLAPAVYQVTLNGRTYEVKGSKLSFVARENDILAVPFGGQPSLLTLNMDGSVARATTHSEVLIVGTSAFSVTPQSGIKRVLQ